MPRPAQSPDVHRRGVAVVHHVDQHAIEAALNVQRFVHEGTFVGEHVAPIQTLAMAVRESCPLVASAGADYCQRDVEVSVMISAIADLLHICD